MSMIPTQEELNNNKEFRKSEKEGRTVYEKQAVEYLREKEGSERQKGNYIPERYTYDSSGRLVSGEVYGLQVVYQKGKRLQQKPVALNVYSRQGENIENRVYELTYNKKGTRETRKLQEKNVIQPSGQSQQTEFRKNLTHTQKENKKYDSFVSKAKAAGTDTSREYYNSLTEAERKTVIDRGSRLQKERTKPSIKDIRAESYKERKTPTTTEQFAKSIFEKQGRTVENLSGQATILNLPNVGPTGQPRRDAPASPKPKVEKKATFGTVVQNWFDTTTSGKIQEFKEAGVFLKQREKQGDKQTRNIILAGVGYTGLTFTQAFLSPVIHPVQTVKGINKVFADRASISRILLFGPLAVGMPTTREAVSTVQSFKEEPVGTVSRAAGGIAASVLLFKGAKFIGRSLNKNFVDVANANYEASKPYSYTPPKGSTVIDLARTSKPGTTQQFGVNVIQESGVSYAPQTTGTTPTFGVTISSAVQPAGAFAVGVYSAFAASYQSTVNVLGVKNFRKRRTSKASIRKSNLNRAYDPRIFADTQKGQVGIKLRGDALRKSGVKERVIRKDPFGNVEIADKGRSARGGRESLITRYDGAGEKSIIQSQPVKGKKPATPQGGNIATRQKASKEFDTFLSGQQSQIQGILIMKQKARYSVLKREAFPEKRSQTSSRQVQTMGRLKQKKVKKQKVEQESKLKYETSETPGFRPGVFARMKEKVEIGQSSGQAIASIFGSKKTRKFIIVDSQEQVASVNLPAVSRMNEIVNPAYESGSISRNAFFNMVIARRDQRGSGDRPVSFEARESLGTDKKNSLYGFPIPIVKVDTSSGVISKSEVGVGFGQDYVSVQDVSQAQGQTPVSAQAQDVSAAQDIITAQDVGASTISTVTVTDPFPGPGEGPGSNIPEVPGPKPPPPFVPFKPPYTPPQTKVPPEPGPRPPGPNLFLYTPPAAVNKQRGQFKTLVRRRGKFRTIGVFGSAVAAVTAGKSAIDFSPAASFKVEGNRGSVFSAAQKVLRSKKYRRSKVDNDVFVEKSTYRINTPGELLGITQKGIQALKFGRKKPFGR